MLIQIILLGLGALISFSLVCVILIFYGLNQYHTDATRGKTYEELGLVYFEKPAFVEKTENTVLPYVLFFLSLVSSVVCLSHLVYSLR